MSLTARCPPAGGSVDALLQRRRLGVHYDPDAFGQFSEGVARYLGTARFLVFQSVVVIVWIVTNQLIYKFDGDSLGLLTLLLSLQAAYAAPLILLAQNRQEERDGRQSEVDRDINARTQADTEFLAREIASVRMSLSDMVTMEDLRDHLNRLSDGIERLAEQHDGPSVNDTDISDRTNRRAG
jgi:uncharacterized membrane protein